MTDSIDEFDRKILSLVQRNNQKTTAEIGEAVGLSKSAVQRRLSRMRGNRSIIADVAIVDPDMIGPYLTFILQITAKNDKPETMARISKAMHTRPEVQQSFHITGPFDFIAVVNVKDQRHFTELTQLLLYNDPDIERFETCLVVERTKTGLSLPLTE